MARALHASCAALLHALYSLRKKKLRPYIKVTLQLARWLALDHNSSSYLNL